MSRMQQIEAHIGALKIEYTKGFRIHIWFHAFGIYRAIVGR